MMTIDYNYFFQVELLHKYFANGLCNDFTIIPSVQTQAAMGGNRILAKQYGNKLYTGVQIVDPVNVTDPVKPFIVPPADLQFSFFLRLNNSLFFNYTNLPVKYPSGKIYYYTNRNNNVSNGKNFISQFVAYNNATAYNPGDIATGTGGVIFQCTNACTGVTPTAAHSNNWMKIDKNQYSSEADVLQWMPSVSTYMFDTVQPNAVINVFGYNIATGDFSINLLSKTTTFKQGALGFTLNLSALSPGKYKLNVNGVEQWIYINDELSSNPVFAVIEIFNDSSLATNYKLLVSGNLKSPLYTINFLNRATIWKYILKSGSEGIITAVTPDSTPNSPPDEPPDQRFPAVAANTIISKLPIPLSETPLDLGLELSTIDSKPKNPKLDISDVACASPQILTNFKKGTINYACSEIFLNH